MILLLNVQELRKILEIKMLSRLVTIYFCRFKTTNILNLDECNTMILQITMMSTRSIISNDIGNKDIA